jgi:uncharacterized tellurite resistance protein B-like protein
MAHVDGEYHSLEEDLILKKAQKLYPDPAVAKTKLHQAAELYKSMDSQKIPGIIRDTFKQHGEVKFSQKYKIYTDMYEIINADGRVDESETKAIDELKQIIDMAAGRE